MIVYSATHPEQIIDEQCAALLASPIPHCCFAVNYAFRQYYLPEQPLINLVGIIALTRHADKYHMALAVMRHSLTGVEQLAGLPSDAEALQGFAALHGIPWFDLSAPLVLAPATIPKPWGQEIWLTGIEARGQSAVTARGRSTPLPWLLSLMPRKILADDIHKLILLKILDPLPDEVYGDLYFEMHQQKQEVYVVTHVDSEAWPDGTGGIRLGFNREMRARFVDDLAFKTAYLAAVKEYEVIRREIDRRFDLLRVQSGRRLDDPVDVQTLKAWHETLAPELLKQEYEKREAMHAFTAMLPLQVGDVIKVPCLVPHALQHGVRTVEFQTPVYERKILSFAQKVLTQTHWDTEDALQLVQLDAAPQQVLKQLLVSDDVVVEQVVEFDDFFVHRINLQAGAVYSFDPGCYGILMVISGSITHSAENNSADTGSPTAYGAGQAMLVPACIGNCQWIASEEGAMLLLALPLEQRI